MTVISDVYFDVAVIFVKMEITSNNKFIGIKMYCQTYDDINSEVNGNHEITTLKQKRKKLSPPLGFETWSCETKSHCATKELC